MNRISFLLISIAMLSLSFNASADNFLRGDNNQDGKVNINDVTGLINYLLTDQWANGPYDNGFWVVFTDNMATKNIISSMNFMKRILYIVPSRLTVCMMVTVRFILESTGLIMAPIFS